MLLLLQRPQCSSALDLLHAVSPLWTGKRSVSRASHHEVWTSDVRAMRRWSEPPELREEMVDARGNSKRGRPAAGVSIRTWSLRATTLGTSARVLARAWPRLLRERRSGAPGVVEAEDAVARVVARVVRNVARAREPDLQRVVRTAVGALEPNLWWRRRWQPGWHWSVRKLASHPGGCAAVDWLELRSGRESARSLQVPGRKMLIGVSHY